MAVIKILPRHSPSYGNLINYILKEGNPHIFTHNLHSDVPSLATKEFLQNESFRTNTRADQVYLYHEIISFSNQDSEKITPEILEDIGRKYIELRGNDGVYLGAVHQDKAHTHIHFCTSGTKLYTGKAMRLARDDLRQLKISLEEYHKEKYPQLEKSFCDHGKGNQYLKNREWQIKNRNNMKTEIEKKVNQILENAKTQKEFLDALRANDLYHYERKAGELTGIVMDDTKFRFSRLEIDIEKLSSLAIDLTEEQKALKEIEELRNQRQDKYHNRVLLFEENGNIKTISYGQDVKEEYLRDADGKEHWTQSELTTDELIEFENINSVMDEFPDRFDTEPDLDSTDLDVFDLETDDDREIDDEPELEQNDEMEIDSDHDLGR